MSDRMSEYMPERMSDWMSEYIYICHIYIYIQMVCQKLYARIVWQGEGHSKKTILTVVIVWYIYSGFACIYHLHINLHVLDTHAYIYIYIHELVYKHAIELGVPQCYYIVEVVNHCLCTESMIQRDSPKRACFILLSTPMHIHIVVCVCHILWFNRNMSSSLHMWIHFISFCHITFACA